MHKKLLPFLLIGLLFSFLSSATVVSNDDDKDKNKEERLEWFKKAKLGIFIHWGYYGVNGVTESWSLKHKRIGYEDYLNQGKKFTASGYNAEAWASLFKEAGARYVVMTTKHHDGIALWDTQYSTLNTVDHAKSKKDLVTPYVNALRKEGLKVGLYYSLCDWSHPDYTPIQFDKVRKNGKPYGKKFYPQKGQKHLTPWARFQKFYMGQLEELSKTYHPDLYWFDGDWEHKAEEWDASGVKDSLLSWNPHVIVNSRLQGYGDYKTPEQGNPVVRPKGAWELCMTMNDNWGYFPTDKNYKPSTEIVRTFVECISKGGNLLLNIGPKPDGTIADEQQQLLKDLGRWVSKHDEAIFGTKEGLPYGHFYGPSTVSEDNQTIYLYLYHQPNEFVILKGLTTKVENIRVVGSDKKLKWKRNGSASWSEIPGIIRIQVPQEELDQQITVIAVDLKKNVKLYRGHGKAIELNN